MKQVVCWGGGGISGWTNYFIFVAFII